MDPDQTAPMGAVWSRSMLFVIEATKTFWQTTKADATRVQIFNDISKYMEDYFQEVIITSDLYKSD